MDILDQMEAWRKNARFISEQDFFSRMMFEIRTNRKEIERLREALQYYENPNRFESEWDEQFKCWVPNHDSGKIARAALKEKE